MSNINEELLEYSECLEFYRICGYGAAFVTIFSGIMLFIMISTIPETGLRVVIWGAIIGTIAFLIGGLYFPRSCSFCLLTKFHLTNAYMALNEGDFKPCPWLTAISSTFFLMGFLGSFQPARLRKTSHYFWLSAPGYIQTIAIGLLGVLLTMFSTGYIFTLL